MDISKVAIIAAPTREPCATIKPGSNIARIFTPTLLILFQCQQLLREALRVSYIHAYWSARIVFQASQIIAGLVCIILGSVQYGVGALGWTIWQTRSAKRWRKKIAFEFVALMLGSGGNAVCLILFWPGWWILAMLVLTTRLCFG
ncbi:hypothetical protein M426DRAFT_223280 [Hypoxylon sp. CI-4A]|nr:hypothetical protein M426DRAFT_223280 [Hypoxylon sp. CI-4A]